MFGGRQHFSRAESPRRRSRRDVLEWSSEPSPSLTSLGSGDVRLQLGHDLVMFDQVATVGGVDAFLNERPEFGVAASVLFGKVDQNLRDTDLLMRRNSLQPGLLVFRQFDGDVDSHGARLTHFPSSSNAAASSRLRSQRRATQAPPTQITAARMSSTTCGVLSPPPSPMV